LQTFVIQKFRKLMLSMAGVWPPETSFVYGLWIKLFLKQIPKYF